MTSLQMYKNVQVYPIADIIDRFTSESGTLTAAIHTTKLPSKIIVNVCHCGVLFLRMATEESRLLTIIWL